MHINLLPEDQQLSDLNLPLPGERLSPQEAMALACSVALRGFGFVRSNPPVGAVLVNSRHQFLAASAHMRFGESHAEVNVMEPFFSSEKHNLIRGATLYVTLEPCAHAGKTPSCALMLARLPLGKIVVASLDPNPLVNGAGGRILREAGREFSVSSAFSKMARGLHESFMWHISTKRPFVGLKAAMSLDGLAFRRGASRAWITGKRARDFGHWLRMRYDALVVGSQTVVQDNPYLNVRHPSLPRRRTPLRVILDPKGRALNSRPIQELRMLSMDCDKVLWILDAKVQNVLGDKIAELTGCGARVLFFETGDDERIAVDDLCRTLYLEGITSILLEGGLALWMSFLSAGAVNRAHFFYGPKLFTQKEGDGRFLSPDLPGGDIGQDLLDPRLTVLGKDFLIEGLLHDSRISI